PHADLDGRRQCRDRIDDERHTVLSRRRLPGRGLADTQRARAPLRSRPRRRVGGCRDCFVRPAGWCTHGDGIGIRRVSVCCGRANPARARVEHDVRRRRSTAEGTAMTAHLLTIARLELTAVARLRWIRLLRASFALLAAGAAYSAGAAEEMSGAAGFARVTMALVPVVLILVPL